MINRKNEQREGKIIMNRGFKQYATEELLMIANNVTGEYTDKQVRQAKLELYNRGVDDKVIADIMEEKEEAFMRRLDAAARAEQARMDRENEKNREVGYHWWEMVALLIFAPFHLFYQRYFWFCDMFPELRRLKAEKYDRKFRQRLALLIAGDALWVIAVIIVDMIRSAD